METFIFDINIKPNQYKITEEEIKNEEREHKAEKVKENNIKPLFLDTQNNKVTDKQSNNFETKDNFENFYEDNDENNFQNNGSEEIEKDALKLNQQ